MDLVKEEDPDGLYDLFRVKNRYKIIFPNISIKTVMCRSVF